MNCLDVRIRIVTLAITNYTFILCHFSRENILVLDIYENNLYIIL